MACSASIVGVVLTDTEVLSYADMWFEELYRIAKKVTFVMLPRAIIQWKSEDFWRENFDNILILEDVAETYPFVGGKWDGTATDAIHILALIGRYHRLVDLSPSESGSADSAGSADSEKRPVYDMVLRQDIRPASFVLYTQFFASPSKPRAKELRECLRRNVKCKWIDRVVLLTEKDESIAWASFIPKDCAKIEQRVIGRRLRYADFFRDVAERYRSEDAIVALANADMYMGEELADVWRIQWEDRAICLLRWDDLGEGARKAHIFGPRADSQDVWMFSAQSIAGRRWEGSDTEILLGQPGCDNAILRPLLQQRFLLSNPALSLKTYHLHNSKVRTYTKKDTIYSSVYIHLEPTYLIDTKQVYVPRESPQHLCNEVTSFTVRSSSMSNEITYCTMLEKEGRYRWEPTVENYYFEPAIPVYTWRGGAGVTPNGLVYDLYNVYTGRAAIQQPEYNYWPSAGVDLFTPLRSAKQMVAIPLPQMEVFDSWSSYVVFYLSRYLRICHDLRLKDVSFWLPEAFRARCGLEFPSLNMSLGVPWERGTACWADEVIGFLPGPSVAELGREDVQALRRSCLSCLSGPSCLSPPSSLSPPSDLSPPSGLNASRCVIWQGGAFTAENVAVLREWIEKQGWSVEVVGITEGDEEAMRGASLFLWDRCAEAGHSLWRLPIGCRVVEGQAELSVQGEAQHLSHVADLNPRVLMIPKGVNIVEEWQTCSRCLFS